MTFDALLGHSFSDPGLLRLALVHRSYTSENPSQGHNERLEFLGDAVLQLVVTNYLFREYPDLAEGKMAKIRAAVVSKTELAQVADEIDLGDHLLVGKGEESTGGRKKASLLADTMEAILAAVYLDAGIEACETVILKHWEHRIRSKASQPGGRDFKTRLQEILAARGQVPEYDLTSEGPDHERVFTAHVTVDGTELGVGVGVSKKAAQQKAAEQAVHQLAVSQ